MTGSGLAQFNQPTRARARAKARSRLGRPPVDWTAVDPRAGSYQTDRALSAALFGRIQPALRDRLLAGLKDGSVPRTTVLAVARVAPEHQAAALDYFLQLGARAARRWVQLQHGQLTLEDMAHSIARCTLREFPGLPAHVLANGCQRAAAVLSAPIQQPARSPHR